MSNGASGAAAGARTTAVALTDVDITFRLADGGSYAAVASASLGVYNDEADIDALAAAIEAAQAMFIR